jgi:predicted nucleic acid-binding protein
LNSRETIYASYFDASALVKLVANDADEEPGRAAVRRHYFDNALMFSTSFCVAECLSAFKSKFTRKRIEKAEYIRYVREFLRLGLGLRLQLEDVEVLSPAMYGEALDLVEQYGIDFIDAMQIVTLLKGRFRGLVQGSQSLLITADRELARVARAESARVWECTTEPQPD